ncbi:MAG TPA: hypothetical protein VIH57_04305 [Bacteroidales bacterium]
MILKFYIGFTFVLLLCILPTTVNAQKTTGSNQIESKQWDLKTKIQFASIEKAKKLLTTEDQFTESWSQFDIDSRLHKTNSRKEDLLKFISDQPLEWTIEEKTKINSVLEAIDKNIIKYGFRINFPDEVFFVKTTGQEEGGADGYTRANYVVLKEKMISRPESELQQVIVHELFHILTRSDNNFRKDMYKIIGFEITNEIVYPLNIQDFRITNPDAPQTDSYIVLRKDGKQVDCMMILYSKNKYDGGNFFKYLNVGFLKLKGPDRKEIDLIEGQPIIYGIKEVSNFFEQVGKNTQYIIHPEEILADNFAFAIDNRKGLPSQWIIESIQNTLRSKN